MTDKSYCPTCKKKQPLKLKETAPGIVLEHFGKECTVCGRAFTWNGKTFILNSDN